MLFRSRLGQEAGLTLHGGVVGTRQVGGTTPQLRQLGGQRGQHLPGRLAGGHLALLEDRELQVGGKLAGTNPRQQGGPLRIRGLPGLEFLIPFGTVRLAPGRSVGPGMGDGLLVDREGFRGETEPLLEGRDLLGPDPGTMDGVMPGLVRQRPSDDGVEFDDRGFVPDGLGRPDGREQRIEVLT